MEMENKITIEGTICIEPKKVISPSGIPHRQWTMQHQSEQYEVGLRRKVWLRLAVVVSGQDLVDSTDDLGVSSAIRCTGFVTAHKSQRGDTKIILHAQKVERIEITDDKE